MKEGLQHSTAVQTNASICVGFINEKMFEVHPKGLMQSHAKGATEDPSQALICTRLSLRTQTSAVKRLSAAG